MYELPPIALTLAGVGVALIILVFIAHKITNALFWGVLLGPALGNAMIGFIINIVQGQTVKAVESLRFAPFFLAPIDESFFAEGANPLFAIMGGVYLFLWSFVFVKFLTQKFGFWGLPLLPSLLFVAGMGLPCFRAQVATFLPSLSGLVTPYYGAIMLSLVTGILFLGCFLLWWRGGLTTV